MAADTDIVARIAERVIALPSSGHRNFVAVAGPPGSGKSTLAAALCEKLNSQGQHAGLLGMDGFHLDNEILEARGLRSRKGAPETFDLAGFSAMLERLQNYEEVIIPRFDRALDASIGSAVVIDKSVEIIVVEGNYLLLDLPGWRELQSHWAFSVFLNVDSETLRKRLAARWSEYGFDTEAAHKKIEENDMPNARLVLRESTQASLMMPEAINAAG